MKRRVSRVSLKKRTVKMDRKLKKTTHATFFGNNEGGCFCLSGKLLMPVGQCTIVWKTTEEEEKLESRESFFNGIAWMIQCHLFQTNQSDENNLTEISSVQITFPANYYMMLSRSLAPQVEIKQFYILSRVSVKVLLLLKATQASVLLLQ